MKRLVWMLAILAGVGANAQARSLGSLQFEACTLGTKSARPVEAWCTNLEVPENRAEPGGRTISLALAWIPARNEAEPDPVLMLAGGPGQSARDSYPQVADAFSDVNRSRHILLLDQRGTGGSNPLICRDEDGEPSITSATDESPQAAAQFAKQCAEELGKTADLRFYTTTDAIQDLDHLRQAVGAAQINLVGISYGTRVAQQYARTYPEQTRSVVLDSVAPNSLVLGQEHARNLENIIDTHIARCAADTACKAKMGDVRAQLNASLARLKSGELKPVRYRDSRTGEWLEATPSAAELSVVLRFYMYSPNAAALLPLLVKQVADGDYTVMLAQSNALMNSLSGEINHGMQLSVMCTEDADEMRVDPEDADTLMGGEFVEFIKAQCDVWPSGERSARFREPLKGATPVLAISGELDPVTPPRYGDQAIAELTNARHLVLKGQGHSVLGVGCMPKLFAQFVENTDAKALDSTCLDRLRPHPPFTGLYGWEP